MLKASSSILCRNLTTGASSTSDVAASLSSAVLASIVDSSNSKSSPMMLSMASVAVVELASTILVSLSYSAMIQSTPICVANLIFSPACWSDGSAVATMRRLFRLRQDHHPEGLADLDVEQPLWQPLHVDRVHVQQGRAERRGHGVRQVRRGDGARARSAPR